VSQHPSSSGVLVFVGSYTQPLGHAPHAHGAGVTVLEVDVDSGVAQTLSEYGEIANPGYLCVDVDRHIVYVVSELGTEGTLSALRYDEGFRTLIDRSVVDTGGTVASYVSLVGTDFALVSNYGDGSLASFALRPDGGIDSRVSLVQLSGSGPNLDRQEGPHAHWLGLHPSNGWLYAADLGADTLLQLSMHRGSGQLAIESATPTTPGSGPRHIAFNSTGDRAYVVNELSSGVGVFDVRPDGVLVGREVLSALPADSAVESSGADIAVTADGGTVFASNRGHNSVVRFKADASGELQVVDWTATADIPRSITLTPDGRHLLVANQDADLVQIYQCADDGQLTLTFSFPIATPVCIKCV
jgi:6-phosphogluconolactonase